VTKRSNILSLSLAAAAISALAGILIWLCLDRLLPFIFLLSPFFLLLGIPVGLPILYCWRIAGGKAALWAAAFSSFFLYVALPGNFALIMVLQLIVPAAFIAAIADLRSRYVPKGINPFIPLSAILSTTTLLITITALIFAIFLTNTPAITLLLDNSINEMVRILTLTRALPSLYIIQFEISSRADNYVLIIGIFALYSFIVALTNFYLASRFRHDVSPERRPRDHWPYSVSHGSRIQIVLLLGATLVSFFAPSLSLNDTVRNCFDILSMMLILSFTLTGLAAIHLISHDKVWRPFLLTTIYCGLVLLFASLSLAFLGVFVSSTPYLQRYKNSLKPLP